MLEDCCASFLADRNIDPMEDGCRSAKKPGIRMAKPGRTENPAVQLPGGKESAFEETSFVN
jgi:hypothetical protein